MILRVPPLALAPLAAHCAIAGAAAHLVCAGITFHDRAGGPGSHHRCLRVHRVRCRQGGPGERRARNRDGRAGG